MRMRFDIQTVQQNVPYAELLRLWRFLDRETRFTGIWLMDHLLPPAAESDPEESCFESWTLLAAAAQATERLRLGCLVSSNTFRHPALLAKMAVTIDHVSDGRLDLGLGAGWFEAEHRAFGIALPPMRERQERLEEAAALLRACFSGEKRMRFEGTHYALRDAPFSPGFVQRPHPPLLIGGMGERRTLRTVARHADVANLMGPLSLVRERLEVLRRHCQEVGRDWSTLQKTLHAPLFAHEDAAAVERVTQLLAAHTKLPIATVRSELPVGTPDQVRETLQRFAALGITAIQFPAPAPYDLDAFRRLSDTVVAAFDA